MKTIYLLALFTAVAGGRLLAQADADADADAAPLLARPLTQINSDSADFDMNAKRAVYRGHVFVQDAQVKMKCEWLVVDLPADGGHLSHILAETNVVIDFMDDKGQTNHITSQRAVYAYNVQNSATNETVTLTGRPKVENAQSTTTGDEMVWDRVKNNFSVPLNPKIIFKQNPNGGTNTSPLKLF